MLFLALLFGGCAASVEANEAQRLLVQLSDLPSGFSLNPAESFPVSLESVLAEPWSAGVREIITRERLSGYQRAFSSDRGRHVQCNVAVYRSPRGARRVFAARADHFSRFAVATGGRAVVDTSLGDEARMFRYRLGDQPAVTVTWRSHASLSSCTTVSRDRDGAELLVVAQAQQSRIARSQDAAR